MPHGVGRRQAPGGSQPARVDGPEDGPGRRVQVHGCQQEQGHRLDRGHAVRVPGEPEEVHPGHEDGLPGDEETVREGRPDCVPQVGYVLEKFGA